MAELSRPGWKRLSIAVGKRCALGGHGLSPEAAMVLHALVYRLAEGEGIPAQEALASELGFEVRRLRARLADLGAVGLVSIVRRGGRDASEYSVASERLGLWAAGELVFEVPFLPDENGTTTEPLTYQNGTSTSRARGYSSSSSSSSHPETPAPMDSPQAIAADTDAMVATLRRVGMFASMAIRDDVRSLWAGHYSRAEVEYAARVAAQHQSGRPTWSYIESVMRTARAEVGVVELRGGAG